MPSTRPGAAARRARPRAAAGRRGAAGAGAGAGRRRHGQDPRHHPPHRPRRRHGRLRADRGARRHLHHPRGRRDARCGCGSSAPAGCRPAPSTPPRCASCATSGPTSTAPTCRSSPSPSSRCWPRRPPPAAPRRPGAAARPGLGGRVGQGQQRRPRTSTPRSPPTAAAPSPGRSPRPLARLLAAYEEVKRAQGRMDMEDVLLLTAGMLAEDERVAAQVRRQYKWFVVDEFQDVSPAPVGAARPVARRARRDLRRRRPGADHLLLRRRRRRLPARLPGQASPAPPRSSWSATTAPPPRWSRPPTPCSPAPPAAGVRLRAQRPAGPEVRTPGTPTRSPRPAARPPGSRSCTTPAAPGADGACCSGSTPSRRPSRRPWPQRGVPYVVRGAARFFERAEVREAVTRIRGAARSGETRR